MEKLPSPNISCPHGYDHFFRQKTNSARGANDKNLKFRTWNPATGFDPKSYNVSNSQAFLGEKFQ